MPQASARKHHLAILAAGAFGLALCASAASAEDYGEGTAYQNSNGEQVEVSAPRHHARVGEYGAPIREVAISRPVRFDDLDLRTGWGAHQLKVRIRSTARALCRQADMLYPVTASDSPPCYPTAVEDAMQQANAAIASARGYANNE